MKTSFLLLLLSCTAFAQTHTSVTGRVFDARTKDPLPFATIGVKGRAAQTTSRADGSFELQVTDSYRGDTLVVFFLGYTPFQKKSLCCRWGKIYTSKSPIHCWMK